MAKRKWQCDSQYDAYQYTGLYQARLSCLPLFYWMTANAGMLCFTVGASSWPWRFVLLILPTATHRLVYLDSPWPLPVEHMEICKSTKISVSKQWIGYEGFLALINPTVKPTWTPKMPKMMKNAQQITTMFPMGFRDDIRVSTTSFSPCARLMTLEGKSQALMISWLQLFMPKGNWTKI